jgi:hypothetical protein
LAVELALHLPRITSMVLAGVFFLVAAVFVYRSFYAMRIRFDSVADAELAHARTRQAGQQAGVAAGVPAGAAYEPAGK